jgi:predicted acylesterase/phospholipase RssA
MPGQTSRANTQHWDEQQMMAFPEKVAVAAIALVFAATLSGCASPPRYGPVGSAIKESAGIFRETPAPFRTFDPGVVAVGWSSSGGGSRAAYLNAAILREVARAGLRINLPGIPDDNESLLGQIDYVSAVSGGSLSSAYFVSGVDTLKRDPESAAWDGFMQKMARNYRQTQWYAQGLFNPVTWAKVLFTDFNRGHIARSDYDSELFGQRTIADLPSRPAIYINAFDVGNRVRFIFSNHFIDTDYYESKVWRRRPGVPRELTSSNDLVFTAVHPGSVRIADAIYASSAFPFVYPHLALRHFGSKIAYQGNLIFLADAGLVDNSGLLTLLTQMRIELGASQSTRLALAVHVDASIDSFASGTVFQRQGIEAVHSSRDTYIGHGRSALEGAIGSYQGTVFKFLEATGVVVDDLVQNYEMELRKKAIPEGRAPKASWATELRPGRLLLRPLAIGLRLRDIGNAYFEIWKQHEKGRPSEKLLRLFQESGIPDGLGEGREREWPASTYAELESRVSEITTDFALADDHRKVLDLVAYLLVHGRLAPALHEWNRVAAEDVVRSGLVDSK